MQKMAHLSGVERTTVVKRDDLLTTLRENRRRHVEEYEAAVEGYLDKAREEINKMYDLARAELNKAYERTKEELSRFNPAKAKDTIVLCPTLRFDLVAPRNFKEAYDQAIQMLEWETRTEVELTATEFRCFVMDKWDWLEDFRSSTVAYLR